MRTVYSLESGSPSMILEDIEYSVLCVRRSNLRRVYPEHFSCSAQAAVVYWC